ncbi:hypothetical protein PR202_ga26676 [Eleusine coracana subsp. coracana]|uniref:Uncharacterized protein n=1 Tax=Eleusine coracana subsp. coracana TaxID=191504 RepID=A0AAV5DEN5_ELECO|nr:hypothetical protein PR202_ga26676 [Eleusine coracana subsp. coracana]
MKPRGREQLQPPGRTGRARWWSRRPWNGGAGGRPPGWSPCGRGCSRGCGRAGPTPWASRRAIGFAAARSRPPAPRTRSSGAPALVPAARPGTTATRPAAPATSCRRRIPPGTTPRGSASWSQWLSLRRPPPPRWWGWWATWSAGAAAWRRGTAGRTGSGGTRSRKTTTWRKTWTTPGTRRRRKTGTSTRRAWWSARAAATGRSWACRVPA